MSKKKSTLVSGLKRVFSIGQDHNISIDVTDVSYRSISDNELKGIAKAVYVPESSNRRPVDKLQIPAMLEPIGRELVDKRMDHEKLKSLAPEIEQAASILVPSLLSPNDFRKNVFNVVIGGGNESEETKLKIIQLISTHFDEELELSTKLSEWVSEAMFNTGAKPIMILPTSVISKMRDRIGSTESLNTVSASLLKDIDGSFESLSSVTIKNKLLSDDDIVDTSFATGVFESLLAEDHSSSESRARAIRTTLKAGLPKAMKHFNDKQAIVFSTDPRILLKSKIMNAASLEAIDSKVLGKLGEAPKPIYRDKKPAKGVDSEFINYQHQPYIDLSDYVHEDKTGEYPAMIELPMESVIPVIIEGAPSNHIGYFIMLNDNGAPISAETDNFGGLMESASGTQRINNLYSAFYGNSQFSVQKRMSTDAKTEILNSIYDSFVKNMMKSKLDILGFDKHKVELTSNISRVMFTRLLKGSQTRILFVPKRFMLYLAFKYNNDGTGRSKLENIKFPLSLKMTLIVTRLISLIESSINRRSLNITLDDGIGNPIELLRSIKKDLVSNKLYGLSYDPSTIIKSVLDKELTIIPNKIPGVEDFALSDTPNNVDYPRPDDAILDEINNMYMLSLGVPPSAMNRLGEDEFSRSVASSNIFFSNQLKADQRPICTFMTGLVSTYISFSAKLIKDIRKILESETTESSEELAEAKEAVAGDTTAIDDKVEEVSTDTRLENILHNIKFTLPSPNLANDKAAFDELREYMDIIEAALLSLLPDELSNDTENADTIKVIRANVKRELIRKHISENSLLSTLDFDALSNPDVSGIVSTNQKIMNIKAALKQLSEVFTAGAETTPETTSW